MENGKVVVEMEYTISEDGQNLYLFHPDFGNRLIMQASSKAILEREIQHISVFTKTNNSSPFQDLIDSAGRLAAGVTKFTSGK